MAVFESLFDIIYLSVVIGLGIRLLPERKEGAKLFGIMAILLGAGDAFHLIPRVVSHLSPLGFEGHAFALSWGQFVTSITMTIFYILYYYFYRRQSGDNDNKKMIAVYLFTFTRIILVLMPMNNWGQAESSYLFGIYRNIPFTILGVLLIYWSYKERTKEGLSKMWLLILFSFLFYIPVVLWSDKFPIVGVLMMPKTVAYLMIVVLGYKYFVKKFSRINILGLAFINLIMGLVGGVFYREFTKFYGFTDTNHLGKIHVHVLTLGFVTLLILYFLTDKMNNEQIQTLKKPIYTFETGLVFTVANMIVIGIYEVVGMNESLINMAALNGLSGIGHIILATGLVLTALKMFNFEKSVLKKSDFLIR